MFEGEEEKIYARAQNMGGFVLSIRLRNRTSHGKKKGKIKKKKERTNVDVRAGRVQTSKILHLGCQLSLYTMAIVIMKISNVACLSTCLSTEDIKL